MRIILIDITTISPHNNPMISIRDLKVGEKAQIQGYDSGDKRYRHKLLSMGLTPGAVVELLRIAPLGDPIQINVRGFVLSLRKSEASVLRLVKVIK